jgi:hypothetical protein
LSEGIQDEAFESLRVSGYAADQYEIGGFARLDCRPEAEGKQEKHDEAKD